jgi:hypothetical protein
VLHTRINRKSTDYTPLLGLDVLDGASLQTTRPNLVFNETLEWVQKSANSGRKWVVATDEVGPSRIGIVPDVDDPTHDDPRINILWGNIMAGGAGVEYFFGCNCPDSDRLIEDFRPRSNMWDQSRYALEFFASNAIPFWDMSNANSRLTTPYPNRCLAQSNGDVILVQLVSGGNSETIDLTGAPSDVYSVKWFDPFTGGALIPTVNLTIGNNRPLNPPSITCSTRGDWVVLLRRQQVS